MMAVSIWSQDIGRMLESMGFERWAEVPSWAIDLAQKIVEDGWEKR